MQSTSGETASTLSHDAFALGPNTSVVDSALTGATRIKPTVLIVDDEQVTRLRLQHLLRAIDCECLIGKNGREALEIVSAHDVDLILLDIQMPELDGFKTLRLLRQLYDCSRVPIIMMTATECREQIVEVFESGANDYIQKPIDDVVVSARIKNQLILCRAQRELKESRERYALAAKGTNDGLWDWNLLTGELYLSPRWRTMVGRDSQDWMPSGAEWMQLIHHEDRKRVGHELEAHLCGETSKFETELRMEDGKHSYRWMLCRGLAVRDTDGLAYRIAGSLTDITEGKVADALTGLPNRTLFIERLCRCVEQFERRPSWQFAVIYMDMDDFKLINDHFGHEVGDQFLIMVAERLESALRKSDSMVARLGGDEFAVLVQGIRKRDEIVSIAMRIHELVSQPFPIADREIVTRASMGIAFGSKDADGNPLPGDTLLSHADISMYEAKKQDSQPYCIFRPDLVAENATRIELATDLRYAIEREELHLEYQPIISLDSRQTVGFEGLLRWTHPVHGAVSPAKFIGVAESNGLIIELGRWVLERACLQAAEWGKSTEREIVISVNASIRQLAFSGFENHVCDAVEQANLNPRCLKLEVTESLMMQNPALTIEMLNNLRRSGITIGIDDFGTGYSSLAYLHQMPLDVLKIDRSFVSRMLDAPKHLAIIRSIVALAKSLGLKTIAEGVETIEQAEQLRESGCDMLQGFYFSKPLPKEEAIKLVDRTWDL